MQGDQRRGFLAKALTVPAVIIDSQEAPIYFVIHLTGNFFQETVESVFAAGNDKSQRFCEPGATLCVIKSAE